MLVSVTLAFGIALLISALKDQLPTIEGLDYRVIQFGLVILVVAFGYYTFDREKRFRRIAEDLVTERIEAARLGVKLDYLSEVQTERDTIAGLLLASADAILAVDVQRRVQRMNPALQELTGVSEFRATGKRCEELFNCHRENGEYACGQTCPFEKVLTTGDMVTDHVFGATNAAGATKWVAGAYAPVRDLDGNIVLAIGSIRDVTSGREMEHLQQDFVSIVSHELRGPLTAIKGFVSTLLLKSDRLSPETREEFLVTINDQADRLNELVEDLLNVSRIESKRLKLNLVELDVEALLRKLMSQFSAKWGDRMIIIDADPAAPLLMADNSRLEEIFINLIDNAVKYSPGGGDINIGIAQRAGSLEVSVEDHGIGMKPEDITNLFRKFHRVSSTETRDIGGTGLGLYIVKDLVEAHGGRIVVTSAPGVGSTFTLNFPLRQNAEAAGR